MTVSAASLLAAAVYISVVKRFGQFLMGLGAAVGVMVGLAMLAHIGIAGAPWLVNIALAKRE
jgi:hypothetical protein